MEEIWKLEAGERPYNDMYNVTEDLTQRSHMRLEYLVALLIVIFLVNFCIAVYLQRKERERNNNEIS